MRSDFWTKLTRRDEAGDKSAAQVGPPPHRRVAVIGPDPACTSELAGRLFQAERNGFHPLSPAGGGSPRFDRSTAPAEGAPDDAIRIAAMHVSGFRRAERPQRWEICVPRTLQVPGSDPRTWKMSADTILVAWPETWLDRSGPEVERMNLELVAAINEAGQAGRLKRVLFVVCLAATGWRPAHPEQTRLAWARGMGFRRGVGAELAQSEGRPGDPLADPGFRKVLSSQLLKSVAFAEVVDNAIMLLNRECPVFFSTPDGGESLADALAWIRRPAPAGPHVSHARLHAGIAVAAAWYLVAMLGTLLYPPALGVPDVTAKMVERQVAKRLDHYTRFPANTEVLLTGGGGERALLTLQDELADMLAFHRHVDQLLDQLRRARSGADTAPNAERLARAHELLNAADSELADRESWLDHHPDDVSATRRVAVWDTVLTDALFQSALLGMVPRSEGFAGYGLADTQFSARVHAGLQRVRARDQIARLDALVAQESAPKFYAEAWVRGTLGVASMKPWADSADIVLPRLDEVNPSDARWGRLRSAVGDVIYRRYVTHAVERTHEPPGPMTFTLRATGLENHWHVDGRVDGTRITFGQLKRGEGTCVFTLDRVMRSDAVTFYLNPNTPHHTWSHGDGRCDRSLEKSFTLSSPSGDLTFPNGQKVHYEVTVGWEPGGIANAGGERP